MRLGKAVPSTLIRRIVAAGRSLLTVTAVAPGFTELSYPLGDGLVAAGLGADMRILSALVPRFTGSVVQAPVRFLYSAFTWSG